MKIQQKMKNIAGTKEQTVSLVFLAVIVVAAIAIQCSATARAALQFERSGILSGELWRILTGNFVHYSWIHLITNVGAFVVIYLIVGRNAPIVTLLSAAATCIGVFMGAGEIQVYRGISGVCFGLIAYEAAFLPPDDRGWKSVAFRMLLWLSIVFWLCFEHSASRIAAFLPSDISVTAAAHIGGFAAGTLSAVVSTLGRWPGGFFLRISCR